MEYLLIIIIFWITANEVQLDTSFLLFENKKTCVEVGKSIESWVLSTNGVNPKQDIISVSGINVKCIEYNSDDNPS